MKIKKPEIGAALMTVALGVRLIELAFPLTL
jgi:hypothetical protein